MRLLDEVAGDRFGWDDVGLELDELIVQSGHLLVLGVEPTCERVKCVEVAGVVVWLIVGAGGLRFGVGGERIVLFLFGRMRDGEGLA